MGTVGRFPKLLNLTETALHRNISYSSATFHSFFPPIIHSKKSKLQKVNGGAAWSHQPCTPCPLSHLQFFIIIKNEGVVPSRNSH